MNPLPRVTAIVGPTASGKSSLAERVASELGSAVVSVDAMQVYRGMDIGTAKTPREERRVELMMVDVTDVATPYSVSLFQSDARACVDELLAKGRHPVLCGGTGLYLDAVIDEMDFPSGMVGDATRTRYEELERSIGPERLHEMLAERDPDAALLIHPHNVRRVIRALEMLDEGVSYARQNKGLKKRTPHYDTTIWGISMDRARLRKRIDDRVDAMFSQGLVDEVMKLKDEGLAEAPTASQAIGYKEVLMALDGTLALDEARELVKVRTRRYAKRQLSWLRRDGRTRWVDYDMIDEDAAVRMILDDVYAKRGK